MTEQEMANDVINIISTLSLADIEAGLDAYIDDLEFSGKIDKFGVFPVLLHNKLEYYEKEY